MTSKRRPAPIPELSAIGRRLRQAREECRYSRRAVYQKGGPHAYTLWLYENGQMNPSALVLLSLSAIYNKDVGWFFEDVVTHLYPKSPESVQETIRE
jgi:transcriptional regulator with XRE-family HTH domain